MKGYKYKSDYLAIKKWGIEAFEKKSIQTSNNFNKMSLQEKDFFA